MVKVLVVDDDKEFVNSLSIALGENFEVEKAHSFEDALRIFEPFRYDVALIDVRLSESPQDRRGLEILKEIKAQDPYLPVLIITAYGDIDVAVESLKLGAEDFIQKNKVSLDDYRIILNNLFRTGKLKRKVSSLESRLEKLDPWEIIGKDKKIEEVRRLIRLVAENGYINVLIRGETGTGKELVARAIHRQGIRKNNPYVVVALASLNKETITSDLFGHEKGSYTGAITRRIGFIEEANGGVIFLDEIGELHPEIQVKLLRVIETNEFTRLGGNKPIKVDIQWVMATHQNLEMMVKEGRFREDLYYRLKTFEIYLPPLRERKEDIPLIAYHFLKLFKEESRVEVNAISKEAMELLMDYDWPGNVRELRHCIQHAILKARLSSKDVIEPKHLPQEIHKKNEKDRLTPYFDIKFPLNIHMKLAELELRCVEEALKSVRKKTEAWKLLGYSNRFALRRRILKIFKKYPELKTCYSSLYDAFAKNK
jgi:DNA-binding NtrC family response regulator